MPEIGIGHNSGRVKKSEKKAAKIFYQLTPASTSILDLSPEDIKERRRQETAGLLKRGQCGMGARSGPLAVKPNDHHKRVDVWGKCRCHMGTADDLSTAAGDDELANHLYINDDPVLRAYGMAVYMVDVKEEDAEVEESEALGANDIEVAEDGGDEEPDDTHMVAPGAYYSTASAKHRRDIKKEED